MAGTLGDLNLQLVYIGGAIAPLLQTEPPFPAARVTKDVDAIAMTTSYAVYTTLTVAMRERGFREDTGGAHVHRWIGPDGIAFDLVPAGRHLGASGQEWDRVAVESAVSLEIASGVWIRHASAPAFLALKWAAYDDRGANDPFASHDLEDILALIASRPGIVQEVRNSTPGIVAFVGAQCATLLRDADAEDLLAAHLGNAVDAAATIAVVRSRLAGLATQ